MLLIRPRPVRPLLGIHASGISEVLPFNLLILQLLPRTRALVAERLAISRDTVNRQDGDAEAIRLVANSELKRRVDVALLLIAAHVHEVLARAAVGQAVDQPGVGMEVEDDRLVGCENGGVLGVREAVRMVSIRDELERNQYAHCT